jgi:hypothetical protein
LSALDRASQHITVKVKHCVQIGDTQHQVINIANANHGTILIEKSPHAKSGHPSPIHWHSITLSTGEPAFFCKLDAMTYSLSINGHQKTVIVAGDTPLGAVGRSLAPPATRLDRRAGAAMRLLSVRHVDGGGGPVARPPAAERG